MLKRSQILQQSAKYTKMFDTTDGTQSQIQQTEPFFVPATSDVLNEKEMPCLISKFGEDVDATLQAVWTLLGL